MWELQQQWNYRQQQQQQTHHRQRVTDQHMQTQLRLSLHASDMLIPTPQQQQQQSASNWVVQTTEDGSEQYYYNTQTQEMRYSMPPEGIMEEKVRHMLSSNESQGSLHDMYEKPPVRPVRAANRVVSEDQGYRPLTPVRAPSTIPPNKNEYEDEFEDDEKVY